MSKKGKKTKKVWYQVRRGVRYREHPTRKHGIMPDRYYAIRYQIGKTRKEEGLGWASDGWSEEDAIKELATIRRAAKLGEGPQRLSEKREIEDDRRKRDEVKALTFGGFFKNTYMPAAKGDKKENSTRTEQLLYDKWIGPVIGKVPLVKVAPTHIERIKQNLLAAKRTPATIRYAYAVIRQVFNRAKKENVFSGDHPISKVKKPKVDNARLRYLSPDEIGVLLSALKAKSMQVHDEALLAVNCGLRFGEIAALKWEDVNYETGTLSIRDAKAGSRTSFMNEAVEAMLRRRQAESGRGLVFPDTKGKRQKKVSKTFLLVANDLFNEDVKDPRHRVSFHTLRHTFGTLLYGEINDLYLVQKALGHKTIMMAQRYAKMTEGRLRKAFKTMGEVVANGKKSTGG